MANAKARVHGFSVDLAQTVRYKPILDNPKVQVNLQGSVCILPALSPVTPTGSHTIPELKVGRFTSDVTLETPFSQVAVHASRTLGYIAQDAVKESSVATDVVVCANWLVPL
jgi:hypothetical protein